MKNLTLNLSLILLLFFSTLPFTSAFTQNDLGELEVSTGLGFGCMTTAERLNYTPSRDGFVIYDTNVNMLYLYHTSAWHPLTSSSSSESSPITSFMDGDVAMIAVAGQSNAEGVSASYEEANNPPLPNVFVMPEASRDWINYTKTNNNVYRTYSSNKPNPLNCIAKRWQDRIDNGEDLPDLYILNVSRGGQAFSHTENNCRWNPYAHKKDWNGSWNNPQEGTQDDDVSLFRLLEEALTEGVSKLEEQGHRVIYMGTVWAHWNGDSGAWRAAEEYLGNLSMLKYMIDQAVGINDSNFFYYYPVADFGTNKEKIIEAYEIFEASHKSIYRVDLRDAPNYNPDTEDHGIFISDNFHYILSAHFYGAEFILTKMLDGSFIGQVASSL